MPLPPPSPADGPLEHASAGDIGPPGLGPEADGPRRSRARGVWADPERLAYVPRLPADPAPNTEFPLANHKSAKKRIRQTLKRQERNHAIKSQARSTVKAVRTAVAAGDADGARASFQVAERTLRRAATKGVYKKTTVSRSISRLAKAVAGA
jgi:small subunit ribosomal protein S20